MLDTLVPRFLALYLLELVEILSFPQSGPFSPCNTGPQSIFLESPGAITALTLKLKLLPLMGIWKYYPKCGTLVEISEAELLFWLSSAPVPCIRPFKEFSSSDVSYKDLNTEVLSLFRDENNALISADTRHREQTDLVSPSNLLPYIITYHLIISVMSTRMLSLHQLQKRGK